MARRQKAGRTTPTPPKSPSVAARDTARSSALRPGLKVKVRALHMGYYDEKRLREGDVFIYTLGPKETKLPKWVEPVDPRTPENITTGKQELRRKHDEILASRMPASGTTLTDDEPATDGGRLDALGD